MARTKQKSRKEKAGMIPRRCVYRAGVFKPRAGKGGWISKFSAKKDKRTIKQISNLPRHRLGKMR